MATIKDMSRIGSKWKRVASGAQAEYEEGVRNPRTSWASATKAAESAYEAGLRASLSNKSFGKGVTKAGDAKWQAAAVNKGPSRFSEGVALSQDAYEAGFAPYREVIARTSLPERGAKGDPKNIERVKAIAAALHNAKISRLGG
jgi:hypothetical protein